MKSVAILGGGVAGLTAARMLHQRCAISVFEANDTIGGLCRTRQTPEGFLFDIGGGHIFHSIYPEILNIMLEYAGGADNLLQHKRNTRIFMYDRFIQYPFENGLGDLPPGVRYDCLMGYINAWIEREKNGESDYNSFYDFIMRRFGSGIADHFMLPYNRKIWCTDPRNMSVDWIKNRVPQAPLEDVVKSALGMNTEGYKHQSTFYYPRKGGIQFFINALAEPFKDSIRTSTPVVSIAKDGKSWLINDEKFDRVVSTIPLDVFCSLYEDAPKSVLRCANDLSHISLLTVLIGLKIPETKPYSWLYLPQEEQGEANRLTYFTNYSAQLAPKGFSSVLVEATLSAGDANSVTRQRVDTIVNDMIRIGLVKRSDIIMIDWDIVPYAYLVHDHAMTRNRDMIIQSLGDESIDFVGRFGSFRYYNMDQVIKQVRETINTRYI
ncbi:MAG: FAD-dependent oxidoreductase [Candidatus Auribacterota bacterium]